MTSTGSILVIGGGVMGRAVVEGAVRAGVLSPAATTIAEPDDSRRTSLAALGVQTAATAAAAARAVLASEDPSDPTPILLATKPQMFSSVAADIAPLLAVGPIRPVISIMAGTSAARLRSALGPTVRIVRAMPNTPARIGQGVTGIARGPGATDADLALATRLFAAIGPLTVEIDESLMDAFTAVAGSGPAYLFFLAEAMERAAVSLDFDHPTARAVVAQTLRGAAALLDGSDPATLRAAVTSKGGTTAAALASLEQDATADALVRAITAARDRGRELAQ